MVQPASSRTRYEEDELLPQQAVEAASLIVREHNRALGYERIPVWYDDLLERVAEVEAILAIHATRLAALEAAVFAPRRRYPLQGLWDWILRVQPAASKDARTPTSAELVRDLAMFAMPKGIICLWDQPLADIPTGWQLCDGTNGSPDLRGVFIKGAAAGADPGATGGGGTAGHSSHSSHSVSGNTGTPSAVQGGQSGTGFTPASSSHTHAPGTLAVSGHATHAAHTAADMEPAYYALAFIMKL